MRPRLSFVVRVLEGHLPLQVGRADGCAVREEVASDLRGLGRRMRGEASLLDSFFHARTLAGAGGFRKRCFCMAAHPWHVARLRVFLGSDRGERLGSNSYRYPPGKVGTQALSENTLLHGFTHQVLEQSRVFFGKRWLEKPRVEVLPPSQGIETTN